MQDMLSLEIEAAESGFQFEITTTQHQAERNLPLQIKYKSNVNLLSVIIWNLHMSKSSSSSSSSYKCTRHNSPLSKKLSVEKCSNRSCAAESFMGSITRCMVRIHAGQV